MAAGDGLVSMKPTSITHSGTSASINADGGVDFVAVTSLSLNGVFTSDYDNYLMILNFDASSGMGVQLRLRASGSDNSTASSYVRQALEVYGATILGARVTADLTRLATGVDGSQRCGITTHFYGPYVAQPTAIRSITAVDSSSAQMGDHASTHNQSTAYDGFTMFTTSGDITGTVHVFGYEE